MIYVKRDFRPWVQSSAAFFSRYALDVALLGSCGVMASSTDN